MKPIAALLIVCLMVSAIPVLAVDCEEWNSGGFFKAATVEDVAGCLQSGADPNARDKTGKMPHRGTGCVNCARPGLWVCGWVTGRSTQTLSVAPQKVSLLDFRKLCFNRIVG